MSWEQVAEKLSAWDDLNAKLTGDTISKLNVPQTLKRFDQLDDAAQEVRDAFYEATKDVNSRERANLINWSKAGDIGGICWLRQRLAEKGLYH